MRLCLPIFFSCAAICGSAEAYAANLVGSWKCAPYHVAGAGFVTTVTETAVYYPDGTYQGTSDLSVRMANEFFSSDRTHIS